MTNIFYESVMYLAILLACLVSARAIAIGNGNTLLRGYSELTEEEKESYDIKKVKRVQILYVLSVAIVTLCAFVFSEVFPNVLPVKLFVGCYILEIIILFLFLKTRWILNWFCKK